MTIKTKSNYSNISVFSFDLYQIEDIINRFSDAFTINSEYLKNIRTSPNITIDTFAANIVKGTEGDDVIRTYSSKTKLIGGIGNDTYILSDLKTKAIENKNQGIDTVYSSDDYTLGKNIENLVLTNIFSSIGKGNELPNLIVGSSGDNLLFGGKGNDTLDGGGGEDFFFFDTPLNSENNCDIIVDFNPKEDLLVLSPQIFKNLKGPGPSYLFGWEPIFSGLINKFSSISSEHVYQDDNDFLIYNKDSGVLAYDVDASGPKKPVNIAILGINEHPEITVFDFMIVSFNDFQKVNSM